MTKDYLTFEDERNAEHTQLYTDMLNAAFPCETACIIGHHLTFVLPDHPPIEIPSADTLIFDHEIMHKIFGEEYLNVMTECVRAPVDTRDEILKRFFYG